MNEKERAIAILVAAGIDPAILASPVAVTEPQAETVTAESVAAPKPTPPAGGWIAAETVKELIAGFIAGTLNPRKKKHGQWDLSNNALTFVTKYAGHIYEAKQDRDREVLVVRLPDGTLIGNAARLDIIGGSCAWGSKTSANTAQTWHQKMLEDAGVVMVPFNALKQAGMDPLTVRIVHRTPAEVIKTWVFKPNADVTRAIPAAEYYSKNLRSSGGDGLATTCSEYPDWRFANGRIEHLEDRHFVGAILLESNGKYLLFDIDRGELVHGVFNPFIVEMPEGSAPTTVEEAYELLKPQAVKDALAAGKEVKRQGEWWFIKSEVNPTSESQRPSDVDLLAIRAIPTLINYASVRVNEQGIRSLVDYRDLEDYRADRLVRAGFTKLQLEAYLRDNKEYTEAKARVDALLQDPVIPGSLRAGDNRPNTVESYIQKDGVTYVSGKVEHTGREHEPITLEGWYVAMPNTAVKSFQISGDID